MHKYCCTVHTHLPAPSSAPMCTDPSSALKIWLRNRMWLEEEKGSEGGAVAAARLHSGMK